MSRWFWNWEKSKAHMKKETQILRGIWPYLIFFILVQYVHAIFNKLVYRNYNYYKVYEQPQLVDLGFMALKDLNVSTIEWITETITFGAIGLSFLFGISTLFIERDPPVYALHLLYRVLMTSSVCLTIRIGAYSLTILPSPSDHCFPGQRNWNPPNSWTDYVFGADPINGCADLIFSSHTMYTVLCCAAYYRYGGIRWLKGLFVLVVIMLGILIVALQKHYSVDVWLALCIVPIVWNWLEFRVEDYVPPEWKNPRESEIEVPRGAEHAQAEDHEQVHLVGDREASKEAV